MAPSTGKALGARKCSCSTRSLRSTSTETFTYRGEDQQQQHDRRYRRERRDPGDDQDGAQRGGKGDGCPGRASPPEGGGSTRAAELPASTCRTEDATP